MSENRPEKMRCSHSQRGLYLKNLAEAYPIKFNTVHIIIMLNPWKNQKFEESFEEPQQIICVELPMLVEFTLLITGVELLIEIVV